MLTTYKQDLTINTLMKGARSEGRRRTSGEGRISSASGASEKSKGTPTAGGYRG